MLFTLIYKTSGSESLNYANVSGASMDSVIVYCDANNFIPDQISLVTQELLLNNTSSSESYLFNLKNQSSGVVSTFLIYDTFQNVVSFIQSSGLQLRNINRQDRNFILA